jgi:hypothetical protein
MPGIPPIPPCPGCGQWGDYAGLDDARLPVFICHGAGGCDVAQYRRGMVISRRPPAEDPPDQGTGGGGAGSA